VLGHLPELEHGLLGSDRVRTEVLAAAGIGPAAAPDTGAARPRRAPHRPPRLPGSGGRALSLTAALGGGLALALVLIPQYAPWLHFHHPHH